MYFSKTLFEDSFEVTLGKKHQWSRQINLKWFYLMYPINETCLPSLFVFGYVVFLSMYIVFSVKTDKKQVFKKKFYSYSVFLSTLQTIA